MIDNVKEIHPRVLLLMRIEKKAVTKATTVHKTPITPNNSYKRLPISSNANNIKQKKDKITSANDKFANLLARYVDFNKVLRYDISNTSKDLFNIFQPNE
ncbi:hypothetical protein H8S90_23380 [Olivibacter sp. SDN3]|uniref:hypothetical protein n=1 Tax=Olivibacter sp. SDN3 TaxID=2764720 RepID=UPI0016518C3E|nr:hypothetical protein [Olivibacter sp. SDN3]QNL49626.1 hypothetical protein H8S90_23380 [Olivibacter sp. SDN3]